MVSKRDLGIAKSCGDNSEFAKGLVIAGVVVQVLLYHGVKITLNFVRFQFSCVPLCDIIESVIRLNQID